jgi:hypothetical protein
MSSSTNAYFTRNMSEPDRGGVAGRASDIRCHPKALVSRDLPNDIDVGARQVEHVVAVTVLHLGVVLHVRKHADSNDGVLRFGGRSGGRRRRCLRPRSIHCNNHQRQHDHDPLSHTDVMCTTARVPVSHRRVETVLMKASTSCRSDPSRRDLQYTGRYGCSVRAMTVKRFVKIRMPMMTSNAPDVSSIAW